MPLDPYHLTPAASLNRLRIVDLPSMVVDAEVKGKTGYDLVSAHAVCDLIRQHSAELKLSSEDLAKDERQLPLILDSCLGSDDSEVREAAGAIATRIARHLGYILLTLHRGDAVNREARADWDDSYWNYWRSIQTVRFGGGLVSGHLGQLMIPGLLAAFFEDMAADDAPTILLTDYGTMLPLVGAARLVSSDQPGAVVLDFGGSFVKRAYAVYEGGALFEQRRMPSIPTQATGDGQTQVLFDFMTSVIAETWRELANAGLSAATEIPVSMAAYINNGQPEERQGGAYAALRTLSDNVQTALSEAVSVQVGIPIAIHLLHDGSAAAITYAGEKHTAVLMLGTAIGVGFPPPIEGLRTIVGTVSIT
jgi:hypothetical protein